MEPEKNEMTGLLIFLWRDGSFIMILEIDRVLFVDYTDDDSDDADVDDNSNTWQ